MIDSQQSVLQYSDIESYYKFNSEHTIDDFLAMKRDLLEVVQLINSGEFTPLSGAGSPEGLITSNSSKQYVDTSVPTLYFNDTIGVNTGWVAL